MATEKTTATLATAVPPPQEEGEEERADLGCGAWVIAGGDRRCRTLRRWRAASRLHRSRCR